MTDTLPDISKTIDPLSRDALASVDRVATKLGVPFLLVGAMARDILLEHLHGIAAGRRTMDMDIGVLVDTWDHYHNLTQALVRHGFQIESAMVQHRFRYQGELLVDIVPFGALADDQGRIAWPPEADPRMSVIGFQEALNHSLHIQAGNGLQIRVVSLPGLALLKLLAWAERRYLTGDDIHDLSLVMRWYGEINQGRLFEEDAGIFEAAGYDIELAGLFLLGKDLAGIMGTPARVKVLQIVGPESLNEHLIREIQRQLGGQSEEQSELYLHALRAGLLGRAE